MRGEFIPKSLPIISTNYKVKDKERKVLYTIITYDNMCHMQGDIEFALYLFKTLYRKPKSEEQISAFDDLLEDGRLHVYAV